MKFYSLNTQCIFDVSGQRVAVIRVTVRQHIGALTAFIKRLDGRPGQVGDIQKAKFLIHAANVGLNSPGNLLKKNKDVFVARAVYPRRP